MIMQKMAQNDREEIISELEQCREDERNSQLQMLQVLVTAGTILTLIMGANAFGQKIDEEINGSILFHLSNLILCTTFGYITSLGINSVLRYHYIRSLEDKLSGLHITSHKRPVLIHWNSFSSSITTRNPKHMYCAYTKMHYLCYSFAAVCPIIFCISITIFLYCSIERKTVIDNVGLAALSMFMALSLIIYFVSSVRAKEIYESAVAISYKEQTKRLKKIHMLNVFTPERNAKNDTKIRNIIKVAGYFIYPKKKDIQKMFLIIIGFLTGLILQNADCHMTINELKDMAICCFLVECLIYQARYQWNDIRGIKKDMEAGKSDRLPVKILGTYPAVIISAVILLIKILSAFLLACYLPNELRHVLSVSMAMILLSSILYEISRSLNNIFWIFVFVSFGYAIRFSAGLWAAYPAVWNNGVRGCNINVSHLIVLTLIISYALLGEYSVVLSWLHEVLFQRKNGIMINKVHYNYLFHKFKEKCPNGNTLRIMSIKENRNLINLWNVPYAASVVLLSIICLIVNLCFINIVLELLFIVFSVLICIVADKKLKLCIGILSMISLLGSIYSTYVSNVSILCLYIYIIQLMYAYMYLYFKFLFNPDFDFIIFCKDVAIRLLILFIGRETYAYIRSRK